MSFCLTPDKNNVLVYTNSIIHLAHFLVSKLYSSLNVWYKTIILLKYWTDFRDRIKHWQNFLDPANIYLFKVNKRNTRRHWRCSGVFIVSVGHISHLFLVFLLLSLSMYFVLGLCSDKFHKTPRIDLRRFRSGHRRCSIKKLFLEISQSSQENKCVGVSFFIKLQAKGLELC